MRTIFKLSALFFLITIIISCGKDTSPPYWENFSIGFNESGKMFQGKASLVTFIANDDKDLDHYELIISKSSKQLFKSTLSDWNFNDSWLVTQNQYIVYNTDIIVPEDADTGLYSLNLKLFDTKGNIKEEDFTFTVVEYPGYNFTFEFTNLPDEGSTYQYNDYITIAGSIDCTMENMNNVMIVLRKSSDYIPAENISPDNSIILANKSGFADNSTYTFNKSIRVGATKDLNNPANPIEWENDEYYLMVIARDVFNGIEHSIPVNINIEVQ